MTFPSQILRQCWFLAGPTAAGKTELGILLAESLNAEIVSMDSVAIYRRMDIGSAKPTPEEQRRVRHHLIDIIEPSEEFSAADFLQHARIVCEEILQRGRTPLFVGGTGLFLRSLLRGIFEGPPADWEFRRQMEALAAERGVGWLKTELQAVDPESALQLHEQDVRRIIRALEISKATGFPASELRRQSVLPEEFRPEHVYWIHPPREWLYDRINQRVIAMIDAGFGDEVDRLLAEERPLSRTASQALGYRELIDWRHGAIGSLDEAVALIQTRTRQFAKRQHTWFRNLEECREVPLTPGEAPAQMCARILSLAKAN